ncbi:hypothetical protein D3C86_1962590 [compost metagenome]
MRGFPADDFLQLGEVIQITAVEQLMKQRQRFADAAFHYFYACAEFGLIACIRIFIGSKHLILKTNPAGFDPDFTREFFNTVSGGLQLAECSRQQHEIRNLFRRKNSRVPI